MRIRKNQANLTHSERLAFTNALLELKRKPSRLPSSSGSTSRYDDYVYWHLMSMMNQTSSTPGSAHGGPAFLPWHRYYINQLELDLQQIDSTVTLPYWDWTVNNSTDPSASGSPWTNDFMGGDGDPNQGYAVTTGPFTGDNWKLTLFDDHHSDEPQDIRLRRQLGTLKNSSGATISINLPTNSEVQNCLLETPYYVSPWRAFQDLNNPSSMTVTKPSFCNRLEGWYGDGRIHNQVHLWVAGATQGSMYWMSSPNDPVFFLHHANVDRLWAQWQVANPNEGYHPTGTGSEVGPAGHNLNDPMKPWGNSVTPNSVLNHHSLGYAYDTDPTPLSEILIRAFNTEITTEKKVSIGSFITREDLEKM
ncbi:MULTISPECIES: tyrosinase family protein [Bacillus cereus group]|uniref:tyrosinase family protein n=1 Tax=Bacillus cereus group TaxID=86661 RepID=UPI000BFDDB5A|nr:MULTISPECIES: tyrosinase family protein [Bacillus cereus group]PGQ47094.1 tyrosinase [Bacillus thuringiensis]PGV69354.1 tyrosinase [Bacillus cereus]